MDRIYIKKLEIFAKHGVFAEEKTLGQKFLISAVLHTDIREAGKTDDLTKSIHYGEVSHRMKEYLESHTFDLLERAVETLAEKMLLGAHWSASGDSVRFHSAQMAQGLQCPWL